MAVLVLSDNSAGGLLYLYNRNTSYRYPKYPNTKEIEHA
jgi:hypothetical protein